MAFGDSDLGVFTGDFGVSVVFNGVTVKGIFENPVKSSLEDQGFGGINLNRPAVRLPYNAFSPMPQTTSAITVNGVNYTIADEASDDDGAFVTYPLKAVS